MKLWTLVENTACSSDFYAEHGLSLYLETRDRKILFDAGQSRAFAGNAEKMGIDLSKVDLAVLSHGHYDHGGGMEEFLQHNDHAPVYVSKYAFGEHYNASDNYIGLSAELKENRRLVLVEGEQVLAEGIRLISCNHRSFSYPIDHSGLQTRRDGRMQPEGFLHEQYLLIEEAGKRILISGCSHKGIINILRWIDCDVFIGGFHFMKMDPESEQFQQLTGELLQFPVCYYTGHCTGTEQYHAMKTLMGDRLHYLSAGSVWEI
ncbi:MAG: MBL fold metallo-hydrolase [Oscillospiraceae bacterium]|nr:MBL fold metallo-hydrolase [Oscillospiraceae bacterium]